MTKNKLQVQGHRKKRKSYQNPTAADSVSQWNPGWKPPTFGKISNLYKSPKQLQCLICCASSRLVTLCGPLPLFKNVPQRWRGRINKDFEPPKFRLSKKLGMPRLKGDLSRFLQRQVVPWVLWKSKRQLSYFLQIHLLETYRLSYWYVVIRSIRSNKNKYPT